MIVPSTFTIHTYLYRPTKMVDVQLETLEGGGLLLKQKIWDAARTTIEEWTGQRSAECSLYGIRVYETGAVLASHVDRLPLVSSAIINVDQVWSKSKRNSNDDGIGVVDFMTLNTPFWTFLYGPGRWRALVCRRVSFVDTCLSELFRADPDNVLFLVLNVFFKAFGSHWPWRKSSQCDHVAWGFSSIRVSLCTSWYVSWVEIQ